MRRLTVELILIATNILIGCAPLSSPPSEPLSNTRMPVETVLPPVDTPTLPLSPPADCPHMPLGGFNDVWRNQQVWPRLGCATVPAENVTGTEAYLECFHSIWLREQGLFVILASEAGAIPGGPTYPVDMPFISEWTFIPDESGFSADAPLMVAPVPKPDDPFPATGRHGWLTNSNLLAKSCRNLAKTAETEFKGSMQEFEHGWLLWNGNVCFVLLDNRTYTMF